MNTMTIIVPSREQGLKKGEALILLEEEIRAS